MNLIKNPWIPVLYLDGHSAKVGLKQLFTDAQKIRDLNVVPPQRVALMRLLLCIAQVALDGPEDEDDWIDCMNRIPCSSLTYLEKWKSKFSLYGQNSFLMVDALSPTGNANVDKLDFALSSGNNPTLFDPEASPEGRVHEDSEVALLLLTYLCFAPGGKIGQTEWSGKMTEPFAGTSEHSPCLECSGLHTIIIGESLLETLHANLITKSDCYFLD